MRPPTSDNKARGFKISDSVDVGSSKTVTLVTNVTTKVDGSGSSCAITDPLISLE
jgi:hypothetical protein